MNATEKSTLLIQILVSLFPWLLGFLLIYSIFAYWKNERQYDRHREAEQRDRERIEKELKEREEKDRQEKQEAEAYFEKYTQEKDREEALIRAKAGEGSGGYIVLDLPDAQRGLFHDLLKGFEEYARLKGYGVSFSVDTTFSNRIAFKFTLTDPDIVVSNSRIRKDLKDYLEKVSQGEPLDDLPQVISIEEHEILVATLKNRISFLQHSYNLANISASFYEGLIRRASTQPFLPAPNIVVQTAGSTYNAPNYTALNSPQAVVGIENSTTNSIRIAATYKERKEQIDRISEVIVKLINEPADAERDEAIHKLKNVKEELEHTENPEPSRIARWLESVKQTVQLGSLGYETTQAIKELLKVFGMG